MSLILQIRENTQDQHKAIEQNPFTAGLFRPDYSVETYKAYLQKLLGFHLPFEASIADKLPDFNLKEREKVEMLKSDLRFLGVAEDTIANVPQCDTLPPLNTIEEVVGAIYVLEGSTLGGQFIKKQIEKLFSFQDNGVAYFNSYGAHTMPMWQGFSRYVDTLTASWSEESKANTIANARQTYQALMNWLNA